MLTLLAATTGLALARRVASPKALANFFCTLGG